MQKKIIRKKLKSLKITVMAAAFLLILVSAANANSAQYCRDVLQEKNSKPDTPFALELKAKHTYVEGKAISGKILFLTGPQYLEAVKNESIPIDAFIILDELPLSEDFPPVSGVIISKKLLLANTHIQVLAEKLDIPLIWIADAYGNKDLRELEKLSVPYRMDCSQKSCFIKIAEPADMESVHRPKSALPKEFDRTRKAFYFFKSPEETPPRELSGDKYYQLIEFKKLFPDLVPDISALSSGYFESFLDNYEVNGKTIRTLRNQLNDKILTFQKEKDDEIIKNLLAEFRKNILESKFQGNNSIPGGNKNLFSEIIEILNLHYQKSGVRSFLKKLMAPLGKFSIRSNNDVEDLFSSGLYRSTVANSLTSEELEHSLKAVWASLYTLRAYQIRKYWGQNEDYLSMPIMVHPYLDDILGHAIGTFKMDAKKGVVLFVNMTLGNNEKATNPTAAAQTLNFVVNNSYYERPVVKLIETSSVANNPDVFNYDPFKEISISDKEYAIQIETALEDFFEQVKEHIQNEFLYRTYAPTQINLEFVIQNKGIIFKKPQISVLQYKPVLNKEVVAALLSGELSRQEADQFSPEFAQTQDTDNILYIARAKKLNRYIPEMIFSFYKDSTIPNEHELRYALLVENEKPFIIVWQSSIAHEQMKHKTTLNPKVEWLKSGYLDIEKSKKGNTIFFTETSLQSVDRSMAFIDSKMIFEAAFKAALKENSELNKIIQDLDAKVEFHTFEGFGQINY